MTLSRSLRLLISTFLLLLAAVNWYKNGEKIDIYTFGLILLIPIPWIFGAVALWITKSVEEFEFGPVKATLRTKVDALEKKTTALEQSIAPRKIAKVGIANEFWDSLKYVERISIFSINGGSFLREIERRKIEVNELHMIVPTVEAINAFYSSFNHIQDKARARADIEERIANIEKIAGRLDSLIGQVTVKRVGCFPTLVFCIADRTRLLLGSYRNDPVRTVIGLRSFVWDESDQKVIDHFSTHFHEMWTSTE